jgi:dolichol kinase
MKKTRLIGGVILMLVAAGIFFFNFTDYFKPAAITLLIVGIALAATARKS